MESSLVRLFWSYRKFTWWQLRRRQSYLPRLAVITLSSCQPIQVYKRWRSFCPEAECSGPLFAQSLLPGFIFYNVIIWFLTALCLSVVSLTWIIKALFCVLVIMGLIFRFQYTASPQREAPRRCVLLPRGRASVSLHINTWTVTPTERSGPKCTISLPVLLTGWDDIRLALCLVIFICSP